VASAISAPIEQINIHTLHQCIGHIPADAIHSLIFKGTITGIHTIDNGSLIICDSCEYMKSTCKLIKSEQTAPLANRFGEEIHSDVWGPSPTASLGGCRYYVTFTDNHTRYTCIDIIKTKDQTLLSYCVFTAWAWTQHGPRSNGSDQTAVVSTLAISPLNSYRRKARNAASPCTILHNTTE